MEKIETFMKFLRLLYHFFMRIAFFRKPLRSMRGVFLNSFKVRLNDNSFSIISAHNISIWSSSFVISDLQPPQLLSYSDFANDKGDLSGESRVVIIGTPAQITKDVAMDLMQLHHPVVTHVVCGSGAGLDAFLRTFMSESDLITFFLKSDEAFK